MPNDVAVQLLYDNIHALPSEDGPINFLPFAHDSEHVRSVKRQVCKGIVELLDANDLLKDDAPTVEPLITHDAIVQCNRCGHELIRITTNVNGVGTVNPAQLIRGIAGLNVECPHRATTLDDMRLHMEKEFALAAEDEASDE